MRLLQSFCYMRENECDKYFMSELATTLDSLRTYYIKFNSYRVDEALARAYAHALRGYNPEVGSLKPYLKSLARDIMKMKEKDDIPKEEIEALAVDTERCVENEAIKGILFKDTTKLIIRELMLPFMEDFIKFGNLLDTSKGDSVVLKTYFPQNFKTVCISLLGKLNPKEFTESIKYLYNKYKEELMWFIEQDRFTVREYSEADYSYLETRTAKRIYIVDNKGIKISNPDKYTHKMYIKGAVGDKEVCKVRYIDLLNQMSLMASSSITNELTEVVDKTKIVRTCGGSLLQINTCQETIYKLLKEELITNILKASNCRIITVGEECVYLLQSKYSSEETLTLKGVIGFGNITLEMKNVKLEYRG